MTLRQKIAFPCQAMICGTASKYRRNIDKLITKKYDIAPKNSPPLTGYDMWEDIKKLVGCVPYRTICLQ